MKQIILLLSVFFAIACASEDHKTLGFRDRNPNAISGSAFIKGVDNIEIWERDSLIVEEVLSGNVPDFLRTFREISFKRNGHKITFWTLPDYLSIGSEEDFVRIPMGPLDAQRIADSLYCSLPTALLVDEIYRASEGAIDPFPFRPKGERNSLPITFEDNDHAIKALYKAKGYRAGQMISGLKKDIIITEKIASDTTRLNHVTIYGWHYPDGSHIQNPTNIHINAYTDYSHGVRLISRIVKIDGKEYDIQSVLKDPILFSLLSNESSPMLRPTYSGDTRHFYKK